MMTPEKRYYLSHRQECLERSKSYHEKHREEIKAWKYAWYQKHRLKHQAAYKKYCEENRLRIREVANVYRIAHRQAINARRRELYRQDLRYLAAINARKALKRSATLRNVNQFEIKKIYQDAIALTKETGIQHHVDHIWPIKGDGFVGLHVPWNLQILTALDNIKKSNSVPCGV
jgi:hypothetical protein